MKNGEIEYIKVYQRIKYYLLNQLLVTVKE